MTDNISDVRRLYSIRDLLRDAGVDVRRRWIVCPLPNHQHRSHTPSFSIFTGQDGVERFRCHGNCGAYGDVIDLAGHLWVPGYNSRSPDHVHQALECLGARGEVRLPAELPRPVAIDPRIWRKYLPIGRTAREYAHARGVTDTAIDHFKLGQDRNYLTIPAFTEHRLMGVKKRSANGRGLRFFSEEGSRQSLFNHDDVACTVGPVFLLKAEIPVIVLWQMGLRACAPTGGEAGWNPRWVRTLASARVIVVGDNDEAGLKYAASRAIDLGGKLKFPPEEYHDIDEWILARPASAARTLEEWTQ